MYWCLPIDENWMSSCVALVVQSLWHRKSIESHFATTILTQQATFELSVDMGCDSIQQFLHYHIYNQVIKTKANLMM